MQRRWLVVALVMALSAGGVVRAGSQAAAVDGAGGAPAPKGSASGPWPELRADSGSVALTLSDSVWYVAAKTPAGTFEIEADTETAARWMDSAAAITDSSMASTVAVLWERSDAARRARLPAPAGQSMTVRRLTDQRYELTADNGAWQGTLRLSRVAFDSLWKFLTRVVPLPAPAADDSIGALGRERIRSGAEPLFEFQVERHATLSYAPRVYAPRDESGETIEGDVLLQCVVDQHGRPEPETMRLLPSSDARLAAVARAILLNSRFDPAIAGGRPVKQIIQMPFRFRR